MTLFDHDGSARRPPPRTRLGLDGVNNVGRIVSLLATCLAREERFKSTAWQRLLTKMVKSTCSNSDTCGSPLLQKNLMVGVYSPPCFISRSNRAKSSKAKCPVVGVCADGGDDVVV